MSTSTPISWVTFLAHLREGMYAAEPAGSVFASNFAFGDRVFMDGDDSLIGAVTSFAWTSTGAVEVQVSWLHSGASHNAWFAERRLTRKEKP